MAKLNVPNVNVNRTFNGAPAKRISKEQELLRSVLACMLWEDTFYEDGESIANRITGLVKQLSGEFVANVAVAARNEFKLRHVPLLLVNALAGGSKEQRLVVADTIEQVVQRPDEITELVAMYWKDGRKPLSAQVKKGLARAFNKFNEYSLAKYNGDGAVKLRDVLFLTHAKPKNLAQKEAFDKLVNGTLAIPDTWETNLSAGKDKSETFSRLINDGKLGALALLRNLRNMEQAGVPQKLIKDAILNMNTERVLPFRFITAAKYAPGLEPELEQAMFKSLNGFPILNGKTALLVDNSGSMYGTKVSKKSELDRSDAACALTMLVLEVCESVDVIAFSGNPTLIPARRGFALRDAIKNSPHGGTYTEKAKLFADSRGYDRIIIITDEQSNQALSNPNGIGYVINVASYQNGVGYGAWNHIDGFSEAIMDYIGMYEQNFLIEKFLTNVLR
jgi:60 kDa SS-A/Ro ribonucleoprotein